MYNMEKLEVPLTASTLRPCQSHNNNYDSDKTLFLAAERGDLNGVKKALKSNANINYIQKLNSGVTKPLLGSQHLSAHSEQMLLFTTPLGASAYKGYLSVVSFLVASGANPYLPYGEETPRDLSLKRNHRNVANYLEMIMKSIKCLNQIDDVTGRTPLTDSISIISMNSPLQKVKNLTDLGADVCKADRSGRTPLSCAIWVNLSETVEVLLAKGAIATGVSAVRQALNLRRNDILKVLVNTKESLLNSCFDDGFTLLTKSISTYNIDIVKYAIEKGADPNKIDLKNNTPLDNALEINNLEIVELLVSKGAKVPTKIKAQLFQTLAEHGNIQIYRVLIENGWDVNQIDREGQTILALSASKEYFQLCMFLIINGANIDLAKSEIQTFRKKNHDFDCAVKEVIAEDNWDWKQSGQDSECDR